MTKPDNHIDIENFDVDIKELATHETPEYVAQRFQQAMLEVLNKHTNSNTLAAALAANQQTAANTRGTDTATTSGTGAKSAAIASGDSPQTKTASASGATAPSAQGGGATSSTTNGGVASSADSTEQATTMQGADTASSATNTDTETPTAVSTAAASNTATIPESTTETNPIEKVIGIIKERHLTEEAKTANPTQTSYWTDVVEQLEKGVDITTLIADPKHEALKSIYDEVTAISTASSKELTPSILRERMIKEIETRYIADEKLDAKKKSFWESILSQLKNNIALEDIYDPHKELSLFMTLFESEFGSLSPDLLKIKQKIYPELKKIYTDLGVSKVYPIFNKLKDSKGTSVSSIQIDKKGWKHLIGAEITFEATTQDKNINWIIYKSDGTVQTIFVDEGSILKHKFTEPGEYVVEAYGNTAEYKKGKYDKAKLHNGSKSYLAIYVKDPDLQVAIKDRSDSKLRIRPEELLTFCASVDVGDINDLAPITWKLYHKSTTKGSDYIETEFTNAKIIESSITAQFMDKGSYKVAVCTGDGDSKKEAFTIFSVGGNWVTSIENNKDTIIRYNTDVELQFKTASFKIQPATDKEKQQIKWVVLKDGKLYEPSGYKLQKDAEGKQFLAKGDCFELSTCFGDEGKFVVEAYMNNWLGSGKTCQNFEVVHPQVAEAIWADENGKAKAQTGTRKENNHLCGKISHYYNKPISIGIYQNNKQIYHLENISTTDATGAFDACFSIDAIMTHIKDMSIPLTFAIQGYKYNLKNETKIFAHKLALVNKSAIKNAYFMHENTLLSPIKYAVPYGTKIKAVVETTNMVGEILKFALYKTKALNDYSNQENIASKQAITVNSDGKAIVEFVLDSSWEAANKESKYYYIGAEKDSWKSFLTDEFTSKMMLAYCEGDELSSGVQVIGMNKYNPDHGDFYDPIINPQVRGWYNLNSDINKDSEIKGWNPYASMNINKNAKHNIIDEVIKYGKPQRSTGGHAGVDIYAPVGTPVYACVDGVISYHDMLGSKAGFMTRLTGEFGGVKYHFQYLHLMEFKKDQFRFYNSYGSKKVLNDGWLKYNELKPEQSDPIVGEIYKYRYSGSSLKIDENTIDINKALNIKNGKEVKKGDLIGYTGSTGNSYQGKKQNHLHFGIKDMKGKRISPYELLSDYINLDASGKETSRKQDGKTSSDKWE